MSMLFDETGIIAFDLNSLRGRIEINHHSKVDPGKISIIQKSAQTFKTLVVQRDLNSRPFPCKSIGQFINRG